MGVSVGACRYFLHPAQCRDSFHKLLYFRDLFVYLSVNARDAGRRAGKTVG
jgi:hypothetical protein